MLLRSSSTPVLGSLISSISESPNHHHHNHHPSDIHHPSTIKNTPTTNNHNHRLSFHQSGSLRNTTYSCNSSPISPAVADLSGGSSGRSGVQRTLSEGNLQGLAHDLSHPDEFSLPKKFSRKPNYSSLEPIPSVYRTRSRLEDHNNDEEDEEEEEEEEDESYGVFANSGRIVENLMENSNEDTNKWDFNEAYRNLGLGENKKQIPELYLARGLGVGGGVNIGFGVNETGGAINGGGGGGGEFVSVAFGRGDDGGNNRGVEEHYQKLVEENPGNPLCLRNYAQFLYESKKDLPRAEEYYSRAILADPKDGEVLSQMAKLVWELHHDLTRASNYFDRAVQAAPEDSHVHASYASFLWETEEGEEEHEDGHSGGSNPSAIPTRYNTVAHASATAY